MTSLILDFRAVGRGPISKPEWKIANEKNQNQTGRPGLRMRGPTIGVLHGRQSAHQLVRFPAKAITGPNGLKWTQRTVVTWRVGNEYRTVNRTHDIFWKIEVCMEVDRISMFSEVPARFSHGSDMI